MNVECSHDGCSKESVACLSIGYSYFDLCLIHALDAIAQQIPTVNGSLSVGVMHPTEKATEVGM